MRTLTIKECRPFIVYFRDLIADVGLMQLLKDFFSKNQNALGEAIKSWYVNMQEGEALQIALRNANPKLAPSIEELLAVSTEQGVVHLALGEMCDLYDSKSDEEDLLIGMSLLVDKFRNRTSSGIICEECFQRDFGKVIKRIIMENAFEVIFHQEEELFFHHRYMGAKAVHYIEPSHSKTCQSFVSKLGDSAREGTPLLIDGSEWSVREEEPNRYRLQRDEISFLATFK